LVDIASYFVFFSVVAGIYAVSVLGLNLQWGFTGIMNIGVVGFFGFGAYAAALITGPDYPDSLGGLGLPPVIGYLGAILASGIV
ncbi:ABC transporter permease subunit, partial [Stenotrophomonas maltophilia]|uniref:ABC transporter permease subunit n=1 Tax=Stenotrophomonas maltophilia TaxID=40324 RepID=UPI003CCFE887